MGLTLQLSNITDTKTGASLRSAPATRSEAQGLGIRSDLLNPELSSCLRDSPWLSVLNLRLLPGGCGGFPIASGRCHDWSDDTKTRRAVDRPGEACVLRARAAIRPRSQPSFAQAPAQSLGSSARTWNFNRWTLLHTNRRAGATKLGLLASSVACRDALRSARFPPCRAQHRPRVPAQEDAGATSNHGPPKCNDDSWSHGRLSCARRAASLADVWSWRGAH